MGCCGCLGGNHASNSSGSGWTGRGSALHRQELRDDFMDVDRRILDMARDWPADKYDYKLKPEMRTFGAVLVHVASGNVTLLRLAKVRR